MTQSRMAARCGVLVAAAVFSGCSVWRGESQLPFRNSVVRDQLLIYSDFALPRHHRLLDELAGQREEVALRLQLPKSDEPIQVYLFESAERYNRYMQRHYPDFPLRRAFFVETDTQLAVFAHWGGRVAEDLRHEVAHGYLHAVVPNIPLWLDEGLAEYFEVPRGSNGLNRPHVDLLAQRQRSSSWRPDLPRLEGFTSPHQMQQIDYAEAWLWVQYLLDTTDERRSLFIGHLRELHERGRAAHVSEALAAQQPSPNEGLLDHLASLTPN